MKQYTTYLVTILVVAVVTVVPTYAFGAFTSLSPSLPLMGQIGSMTMAQLLERFFVIAIALSGLLAVIMVAVGGFEYMTTDSVFRMGNAKERIADAIIGLLIVLMAILVLKTINPCLVTISIFNASNNTLCTNPT